MHALPFLLSLALAAALARALVRPPLAGMTFYGELRSISALIERTRRLRDLRELDSWGRPS